MITSPAMKAFNDRFGASRGTDHLIRDGCAAYLERFKQERPHEKEETYAILRHGWMIGAMMSFGHLVKVAKKVWVPSTEVTDMSEEQLWASGNSARFDSVLGLTRERRAAFSDAYNFVSMAMISVGGDLNENTVDDYLERQNQLWQGIHGELYRYKNRLAKRLADRRTG
jgi:hypothetical protein